MMRNQTGTLKKSYRFPTNWRPSENTTLLILSVVLGITTAFGVWLFRNGIDFFQRVFRDGLLHTFAPIVGPAIVFGIIPVLALAGLIVGFLMDHFVGEERAHGVAGIMEATALSGGRLRYRTMPIKAALASFSLGAGASVGPEDPSVQIGANLGSFLGQRLRLSDDRVRLLVAAGVGGGIAAAFRAPIAGVFFALEVVLGDFSTGAFGVVVLTAVVSAALTQAFEAGGPIFTGTSAPELGIAAYSLGGLQELPLYMLLGVLIAPLSALFIRALYWQHDLWHHLHLARPLKTALAGALVGVLVLFVPQVMGTGQSTLNAMLNQSGTEFTLSLLLVFIVVKIIATTMSLGGGFQGGMFAPSLFVGAAAGRIFGQVLIAAFPGTLTANPAAFAIAGMAAAMTGVIRAPITAVLLLFELTADYRLILPIMLTTVVCLIVVERLAPEGIYHLGLARSGIRLSHGRDVDILQTIMVRETMSSDLHTVPSTLPVADLGAEFAKTNTHGLIVVDDQGLLFGIVTLQDLARAHQEAIQDGRDPVTGKQQTVADICTQDVITVTPDMPVAEGLNLLSSRDLGRLPVVESANSRKPIGILRRRDIIRAYDLATHHKLEAADRIDQVRMENYSRTHIVELTIQPGSLADNHLLRDVPWPADSVVATVRRKGRIIVPHGNTQLQAGDLLMIVTTDEHKSALTPLTDKKLAAVN